MSKIKKGWIDIGSGATQLNADSIPAGSTYEIPLINHGHSEIISTLLAKVTCDTSSSSDFESGVVFCEEGEHENDAGFYYRGRTLYLGSGAIDITPENVSNGTLVQNRKSDTSLNAIHTINSAEATHGITTKLANTIFYKRVARYDNSSTIEDTIVNGYSTNDTIYIHKVNAINASISNKANVYFSFNAAKKSGVGTTSMDSAEKIVSYSNNNNEVASISSAGALQISSSIGMKGVIYNDGISSDTSGLLYIKTISDLDHNFKTIMGNAFTPYYYTKTISMTKGGIDEKMVLADNATIANKKTSYINNTADPTVPMFVYDSYKLDGSNNPVALGDTSKLLSLRNNGVEKFVVYANGSATVSNIVNTVPSSFMMEYRNASFTHGYDTSVMPSSTTYYTETCNSTTGSGILIRAVAATGFNPYTVESYSNDTANTAPLFNFVSYMRSGSGRIAIPATSSIYTFSNAGTVAGRLYGNGLLESYAIDLNMTSQGRTQNPLSGRISLYHDRTLGTSYNHVIDLRTSSTVSGYTNGNATFTSTNTFFALGCDNTAGTGAILSGVTDTATVAPMMFRAAAGNGITTNTSTPHFDFQVVSYSTGSTFTNKAGGASDPIFRLRDYTTEVFQIMGQGDTYIKDTRGRLLTGNNTTVAGSGVHTLQPGGLGLRTTATSGAILSLSASSLNTGGITGYLSASEYGVFGAYNSLGGLVIRGTNTFTGSSSSTGTRSIIMQAISGNYDITTSTAAIGAVTVETAYKGAATLSANLEVTNPLSATNVECNLMVIRDGAGGDALTRFIFKADGDFHYDNTAAAFDSENDIELMKSAKNKVAGWDNRISESQQKRLDELGIVKNGFVSHKKLTALQLGAFEQLWNVIRKVANELGISDDQLMEYAKDYQ